MSSEKTNEIFMEKKEGNDYKDQKNIDVDFKMEQNVKITN